MNLQSLDDFFSKRILRIPDYQRGYSWRKPQLEDLWEDLRLAERRTHFTGTLTLEMMEPKPDEDIQWRLDQGDKAFHIIDGQQRLTTCLILLQTILDKLVSLGSEVTLNHRSHEAIKKQFIQQVSDDGQHKLCAFGYETDNPSDLHLRKVIFELNPDGEMQPATLYTRNLDAAKDFFSKKVEDLTLEELEVIFKTLTQQFKFGIHEVTSEIESFVAFETMNNRGKPLSTLELLKNRLIYLTTFLHDENGHEPLRLTINNVWKTIYEYLGKDTESPLDDDDFLRNHWIMYFGYDRTANALSNFLLKEHFTIRNLQSNDISAQDIEDYVSSLQEAAIRWYAIERPAKTDITQPEFNFLTAFGKAELMRFDRMGLGGNFRPVILSCLISETDAADFEKTMKIAENFYFLTFGVNRYRNDYGRTVIFNCARDLFNESKSIEEVVGEIERLQNFSLLRFEDEIAKQDEGYYSWGSIRYFLYEYNLWLNQQGHNTEVLDWESFVSPPSGKISVEHILPQTPNDPYWASHFGHFSNKELNNLTHSLGNLLPLSRPKNSALQNKPFPEKRDNGEGVGYYNGCAAENEVAKKGDWDTECILENGLTMLAFMEERWDVDLGSEKEKIALLHLEFLRPEMFDSEE